MLSFFCLVTSIYLVVVVVFSPIFALIHAIMEGAKVKAVPAPSADAKKEGARGAPGSSLSGPDSLLPHLCISHEGLPLAKPSKNPECTGAR